MGAATFACPSLVALLQLAPVALVAAFDPFGTADGRIVIQRCSAKTILPTLAHHLINARDALSGCPVHTGHVLR
ncbi:hypothetical protein CWO89_12205 [Bradyrhizobium sp. Leo170]|nr:hypothetical protein CWO89_12205 [Bradyrhizobium sp. Leo170]